MISIEKNKIIYKDINKISYKNSGLLYNIGEKIPENGVLTLKLKDIQYFEESELKFFSGTSMKKDFLREIKSNIYFYIDDKQEYETIDNIEYNLSTRIEKQNIICTLSSPYYYFDVSMMLYLRIKDIDYKTIHQDKNKYILDLLLKINDLDYYIKERQSTVKAINLYYFYLNEASKYKKLHDDKNLKIAKHNYREYSKEAFNHNSSTDNYEILTLIDKAELASLDCIEYLGYFWIEDDREEELSTISMRNILRYVNIKNRFNAYELKYPTMDKVIKIKVEMMINDENGNIFALRKLDLMRGRNKDGIFTDKEMNGLRNYSILYDYYKTLDIV